MATPILSSLARSIHELETAICTSHQWIRVRDDLSRLESTLRRAQGVVDQAEERQWRDERVRSWLAELQGVACDAEDVLDELNFELSRPPRSSPASGEEEEVHTSVTSLSCKIEKIRGRFGETLEQTDGLRLKATERTWPRCGEFVVKRTEVFGREEDKKKVTELVLSETPENPPVIAIVGSPGAGKTTLLQLVYNDPGVREHFPRRGWVRMSKDFDATALRREIMEAITLRDWRVEFSGKGHWIYSQPNYLDRCIKRELEEERFLLVLDDFCDENLHLWATVNLQLSLGHGGSKIILATSSERATAVTENMPLHHLSSLPEETTWRLFQSLAFGSRTGHQDADLVRIGKEIVEKCKGSPLEKNMKVCSVPKEARHLCLVALDSLTDVSLELESEANSLRTILLVIKSVNSAFKSNQWYHYSDDIAHLSFSGDMFRHLKCLRALDLSDTDIDHLPDSIGDMKLLRFLGLNNTRIPWLPEESGKLHNLQTLELRSCGGLTALPKSIGYLTNLHHLDLLNACDHVHLHHGIGRLVNLQTLSMVYIGKDSEHYVIRELGMLVNLRGELRIIGLHNVDAVDDATAAGLMLKEHIEKLTLRWCDPNDDCYRRGVAPRSTGFRCMNCRIEEAVSHDEASEEDEAQQCMVGVVEDEEEEDDMWWIHRIDIDVECKPDKPKRTREEMIQCQRKIQESQEAMLESLRPHGNLKELVIQHYYGSSLSSSWMGDPVFSKLASITLDDCRNCEILPPLGQLPSLKHLLIRYFPSIKRVGREFCGGGDSKAFPALETLEFDDMYEWEEWCGVEDSDFPCLRRLRFYGCMKLNSFPDAVSRHSIPR
ncbi:hypothetical protein B296_00019713 [Ensete ventricosum]|uniref:NB-ARC domain-containing protein n=1 Tax=Ensete ventricosum TaxID=4639 RepID=A0A426ZEU3_ENSVE|nr:hypothetical protein B296_00019713 [Ensete ventricosum]